MVNLPPITHDVEARVLVQIGDSEPVEVGTLTVPVLLTPTTRKDGEHDG